MMTREEAWALLTEFNQDPFHLRHALTVEAVMRRFAVELGYGEEVDFWGLAGLLHDLDLRSIPTSTASSARKSCGNATWTSG